MLPQSASKPAYRIALLAFVLLGIGALIYYRERMLFVDGAWIVFNILNTGHFAIAEHRWGAFITQAVPLLAGKLGLSLKAVLILYSVSFYAFYLGVALLAGRRWGEEKMAVLLLLYLTLFVSDSYFWPNNEVHQGTAWAVLFTSAFFRGGKSPKRSFGSHLFLVVTLLLALSSHLLVSLTLSFLWAYRHWQKTPSVRLLLQQRETLFYTLLLLAGALCRYGLSRNSWYDGEKLAAVKTLSVHTFLSAFASAQSRSFLSLLVCHYWIALPLFGWGLAMLLCRRKGLLLLATLGWSALYYGLVCTVYNNPIAPDSLFYSESEWLGLSLILATPFVLESGSFLKVQKLLVPTLVLVLLVRFGDLALSYSRFHERYRQLARITSMLLSTGVPKAVILFPEPQQKEHFKMAWGTPVESLMLSELEGYRPAVSFKITDKLPAENPAADSFLSAFSTVPASSLNARYFHPDTNTTYRVLEGADFVTGTAKDF